MKKKGFTLIELLAVIVVLAIIALIATPIVMNTIKNSKKGAAERTADNYADQVETSLMTYLLKNGENLPDGEYDIDENGNLVGDEATLTIEMSGTKPSSGTVVIENGQVKKDGTTMTVGDYTVTYDTTNKTFVASENAGNDVEVLCKANTIKVRALVWGGDSDPSQVSSYNREEVGLLASESGKYTPGVSYTCELGDGERTFYVLEESGNNVSLILGTNVGGYEKWISKADYLAAGGEDLSNDGGSCEYGGNCTTNEYGPVTANAYLEKQTSGWTKLNPSQINLPTYDQLYKAAGNKESDLPTWLYSYTDECETLNYGYWTSTPRASDSSSAMILNYDIGYANLTSAEIEGRDNACGRAVRPVITISKSQLG